ncbi:MAG: hypothetical protein HQ556_02325 [Candidatus Marinimicrobia bacterium]|nr:hypothetical protein [Candidatus Neomarinimicrobiota bacterium]
MDTKKCIWMEAGSVDYQLCPLNQNCDICDFYKEMMRGCRTMVSQNNTSDITIRNPGESVAEFTPGLQFINRHFWYKRVSERRIRLGIDGFLWHLFVSAHKIITPEINTTLVEDQCFSWLQLEDGIIYLRTPVPGQIIQSNPLFLAHDVSDSHLYLTPAQDLWFVELESSERSTRLEYHPKDEYLTQTRLDLEKLNTLVQIPEDEKSLQLTRKFQLPKNELSKYLLEISDNHAYMC